MKTKSLNTPLCPLVGVLSDASARLPHLAGEFEDGEQMDDIARLVPGLWRVGRLWLVRPGRVLGSWRREPGKGLLPSPTADYSAVLCCGTLIVLRSRNLMLVPLAAPPFEGMGDLARATMGPDADSARETSLYYAYTAPLGLWS